MVTQKPKVEEVAKKIHFALCDFSL